MCLEKPPHESFKSFSCCCFFYQYLVFVKFRGSWKHSYWFKVKPPGWRVFTAFFLVSLGIHLLCWSNCRHLDNMDWHASHFVSCCIGDAYSWHEFLALLCSHVAPCCCKLIELTMAAPKCIFTFPSCILCYRFLFNSWGQWNATLSAEEGVCL